jgi:hypothetical protein
MPWNESVEAQPSSTTSSTSRPTTTSPSSSPSSNPSTLSTGAKATIAVVIPLVVLSAFAFLLFLFFRRRKDLRRTEAELDASAAAVREMDAGPAGKELPGGIAARELNGADRKKDYDARYTPHELAGGVNSLPPVELV